jgi:imidazoleglycerol-phosphate dehydratase
VVVDEAYADFAGANLLEVAQSKSSSYGIIVTRSLSKSYCLAGIRFGFAVTCPQIARELVKVKDSYNLRGAQAAADPDPLHVLCGIRRRPPRLGGYRRRHRPVAGGASFDPLTDRDKGSTVSEEFCSVNDTPAGPPAADRPRSACVERKTGETAVRLALNLDGTGKAEIATGVGFFDHMLTLLSRHSLIDLAVHATGDLHVDAHHTVEDVGICLGRALAQALGDKAGVRRYGDASVPMDETLVTAAVDLSGRPLCVWKAEVPRELLGTFNAELAEEFWRAVASSAALTLHVVLHHGRNVHHIVEGIFKACARALRAAVEPDPRGGGVPSTKGVL